MPFSPTRLAAMALCLAPLAARAQSPVVATQYGAVQGTTVGQVNEWLGIPYASPPVGQLRWYPPQPPAPFTATFQATQFSSSCPQGISQFGRPSTNEDCLYLNVYAPAGTTATARLPVMVWIHGGAFVTGEGADYDGSALASQGRVIVVTINYRLGLLGFLAHPALAAYDPAGSSGDYGLQDQQAAVGYVARNIAAFGGDPARITIFGESAGGASVEDQLTAPGLPKVHAAIIESGAYAQSLPTLAGAEATGVATATGMLGCGGTGALTYLCLHGKSAADIVNAVGPATLSVSPNVDGTTLPRQPLQAYAAGEFQHVPVINGSNHDEYRLFVGLDELLSEPVLTPASYMSMVDASFGSFGPAVLAQYPVSAYTGAAYPCTQGYDCRASYAYAALVTDYSFACGAHLLDGLLAQSTTVYGYELNDPHAPDLFLPPEPAIPNLGDSHASEIPYLWPAITDPLLGLGPVSFTVPQSQLASTMRAFWTSLARYGRPLAPLATTWQPYNAQTLVLSLLPPAPALESNFVVAHHCAFWKPVLLGEAGLPSSAPY